MPTEVLQEPLTAADRCDRCGGQAYLRVSFPPDLELLFCGHHAREHSGSAVAKGGVVTHDDTEKIPS